MKIGIIEVDHYELAYSICRVFDFHENEISFFVSEKMYEQLYKGLGNASKKFKWLVNDKNESLKDFLNRARAEIINEKIELLFLNSIYNNYNLYSALINKTKTRTVLTVHNVNSWFKPVSDGIQSFLDYRTKRKILKNVSAINVLGDELKDYLLSVTNIKKPVLNLPYCIYESRNAEPSDNNLLKFVIPGSIDTRRRDYMPVLDIFVKIYKDFKDVSLILSGKPVGEYGKKIIEICRNYKKEGNKIIFFEEFVPQDEFEKYLGTCDMIISPVRKCMFFGKTSEEYGLSKATGATFDMIKFAKPGIMPSDFKVPGYLKNSVLTYKNINDLYDIVNMIHNDRNVLKNLKEHAISNSLKYSVDNVRNIIQPQIEEIMKIEKW